MRQLFVLTILTSSIALAGDDDTIDRCHLDGNGVMHCSTPNRRGQAALSAVVDSVNNFEARSGYMEAKAAAWLKTKEAKGCRSRPLAPDREVPIVDPDTGKVRARQIVMPEIGEVVDGPLMKVDFHTVWGPYSWPSENGVAIYSMADSCEKSFALWLFKKEHHGKAPKKPASE